SGALGDFKSVFEARPDDPRAEQALAYCHLLLDQLDPAIDHLTTAERSRVKTPELYNNRAYAYRRRNAAAKIGEKADWDKATEDLDQVFKQTKDCVPALYNRALHALLLWQFESGSRKPIAPLLAQAQGDIEAVIAKSNSPCGQLHMEAATISPPCSPAPASGITKRGRAHRTV